MIDGQRVLVTGANGFVGRHLVERLRSPTTELITPSRADVDLTDQAATFDYVATVSPDVVIHLAAEVGGIGANRDNPGRYFYANMSMGLNLIEASRLASVDKFVQVGTVCAYPKFTAVPFVEDDLWDGFPEETNAPYGVAKKALLVMLQAYRDQYGFNGIYLLPANLYGPGDNFDLETSHVIPALIRKFYDAATHGSQVVDVWGTGAASREFLYVDDVVEAIALATEKYDKPDPVNIGTGSEVRIRELVDLVGELTGFAGEIRWDPTKPDGQPRRSLNTDRAEQEFGFSARTGLRDGLRTTIEWWKSQQ